MGTFQVNYDEVAAQVGQLRNQLRSNVINPVNQEYRRIQSALMEVDGETNFNYQTALNENREKAITAASILDSLLVFMSNSSRQIQSVENNIARSFRTIRR